MKAAFLFPGQGSQYPGMLHQLIDDPLMRETFAEINESLSLDIVTLDTADALRSTVAVQLSLLAAGVATARVLIERNVRPVAVAGLSVGAFAAAVVAGSISLPDAASLVHFRATQMEILYPHGFGLAAVVGLSEQQVMQLVSSVFSADAPIFMGNINAPRQIVVAGAIPALKTASDLALRQGASRAELLPVTVPSHCALLASVADALQQRIGEVTITDPRYLYISNVTARAVRTAAGVATDLAQNIAHGVRWHDGTVVLQQLGVELFLEMPPGHVLSDLAQANLPGVRAYPVQPSHLGYLIRTANG